MSAIDVLTWTTYSTCGLLLVILAAVFIKAWYGTRYKVILWQIGLLFISNLCYIGRQFFTHKAVVCVI